MINTYQSNNKSVKIQVVLKDPRTYEQEILSALAASQNVADAPDIISLRGEDLPRFIPQLVAAPDNLYDIGVSAKKQTGKLTPQNVDDLFVPFVSKSVSFADQSSGKGLVYGLPLAIDTLALYRNKTLLDNAANLLKAQNKVKNNIGNEELNSIKKKITTAPKTWTDLAEIVPYITIKTGDTISQPAIALGTSTNIERSYDIVQTLMMQNGVQMTSSDENTATFNQSQSAAISGQNLGEKALQFYLRFANPNDRLYTWNDSQSNDVTAFEKGQVAMMIQYANAYRFIIDEAPNIKKSIDVSPLPQIVDPSSPTDTANVKTMGRMWVESATASRGDKARQAAAWNFIASITSKQGSKTYLSAMKLPSALKEGQDKGKFTAFNSQKTIADTWYKGHEAEQIDEGFISAIDSAHNGTKSAQTALNEAADLATTILQASRAKWLITQNQ